MVILWQKKTCFPGFTPPPKPAQVGEGKFRKWRDTIFGQCWPQAGDDTYIYLRRGRISFPSQNAFSFAQVGVLI